RREDVEVQRRAGLVAWTAFIEQGKGAHRSRVDGERRGGGRHVTGGVGRRGPLNAARPGGGGGERGGNALRRREGVVGQGKRGVRIGEVDGPRVAGRE